MARNIKLVSTAGVDATDLASLVATITAGCKTDQDKMIALWSYVARNPFYHWSEARENPQGATELGLVLDPIAAFNVYGTVICFQVAHLLGNMAEAAGIRARCPAVPGHVVMEAFYEGKWHLFDAQSDCAAYYVGDDGETIISLAELCRDAGKYIRDPRYPSEPFYRFDHYGGRFWAWESKEYVIEHFYHPGVPESGSVYMPYMARGHTIHLDLRRGEKLLRRWTNEGKWYCPADFVRRWKGDRTQQWVDAGPHDPRNPENTYANGELIYEPDWRAAEVNFRDGLYDGANFALVDGQVRPASAGECFVVFGVRSPYLIVGRPAGPEGEGEATDGAVIRGDFFRRDESACNCLDVSTDNGRSWRRVWTNEKTGPNSACVDITPFVEGTYGYLVKVFLRGARPEDAALSNLRLRSSLFLSPVPLPAVRCGQNHFAFSLTEGEGVLSVKTDLSEGGDFRSQFVELKGLAYDPKYVRHLSPRKGRGRAVIDVPAPPGAKIHQMTVHACFGVDISLRRRESAEILWAANPAGPWRSAWRSEFDRRNDKWRWDESVAIAVDPPAERVYVSFVLNRRRRLSLNMVRIHARYRRPTVPLKPGAVKVTHEWLADGEPRTHTAFPAPAGQTYAVHAGGKDIRNVSVTIEVANDG